MTLDGYIFRLEQTHPASESSEGWNFRDATEVTSCFPELRFSCKSSH